MSDVRGRVVMISGGSRGLGRALAVEFAAAGARVSVCGRDEEGLEAVRVQLAGVTPDYLVERIDVTDEEAVRTWVARTVTRLGAPDAIVNNASVLGSRTALIEYSVGEWREVFEVNLTGTFLICRTALPAMIEKGGGSIINVSSGAAIPPRRDWGAYAVSKSALEAFSANLAAEVEHTGVRVNVVDPGAMRTGMREAAYPDEDPETVKEPVSIVPLFFWLASDASSGVTGERFSAEEWIDDGTDEAE